MRRLDEFADDDDDVDDVVLLLVVEVEDEPVCCNAGTVSCRGVSIELAGRDDVDGRVLDFVEPLAEEDELVLEVEEEGEVAVVEAEDGAFFVKITSSSSSPVIV